MKSDAIRLAEREMLAIGARVDETARWFSNRAVPPYHVREPVASCPMRPKRAVRFLNKRGTALQTGT